MTVNQDLLDVPQACFLDNFGVAERYGQNRWILCLPHKIRAVVASKCLQWSFQTVRSTNRGASARTRVDPGIVLLQLGPIGFEFERRFLRTIVVRKL